MSKVKANDNVKVHYTGKLTNGEVFDSSEGREPLAFTVGAGQMISGFDNGVVGMELNEKKVINIPAAEAYGEVRQELIQEVPKEQLPAEIDPVVGMPLTATLPDGSPMQLVVTEVTDTTIVVDGNHPLAGKELIFDVEIVEIS
ncbi:MAG: peptidylprolyl isomerase [Brumimicrobium sp.]